MPWCWIIFRETMLVADCHYICTSKALVTVFGRKGLLGFAFLVASAAHSASKGSDPTGPVGGTAPGPPVPLELVQGAPITFLPLPIEAYVGVTPRETDLSWARGGGLWRGGATTVVVVVVAVVVAATDWGPIGGDAVPLMTLACGLIWDSHSSPRDLFFPSLAWPFTSALAHGFSSRIGSTDGSNTWELGGMMCWLAVTVPPVLV